MIDIFINFLGAAYVVIVLSTFCLGGMCTIKRQLVKANYYYSMGIFSLLALVVLIMLAVL